MPTLSSLTCRYGTWRSTGAIPGSLLATVFAVVFVAFAAPGRALAAEQRLALVIGNAAYAEGPLRNPVNDARAVERKLAQLKFDVTRVDNLKRGQIGRTVNAFANRIRPGDTVVVFYAGHGLQVKGINYLPAVDAEIQTEEDVPLNSLNVNTLLERLDEAKAGVKLVFLDACRNNPYARSFRSTERGLARIAAAPSGTLIHFATRPGSVAADGKGDNGLYTSQLIRHLDAPGVPVEQVLKRVAAAVEADSEGRQEPWSEGSIKGDFYFNSAAGEHVANLELRPAPVPPAGGVDYGDLERRRREEAAQKDKWAAWQKRMQADYDKATGFSGNADLEAKAWERFLSAYAENNPYSEDDERLRAQADARKAAVQTRPAPVPASPAAGGRRVSEAFKDCTECPEMVMIPAGTFLMGSPEDEPERIPRQEGPPHPVSVAAFAMGKYEVTQAQWRAIMGDNPSRFKQCGDACPVDNVSWKGAQEFIKRLSEKTDKTYRLPSEAEWEYAARAGTTMPFSTGATISTDQANFDGYFPYNGGTKGVSRGTTLPVGSFPANSFGLHDMHGNVAEWVDDCWSHMVWVARGNASSDNNELRREVDCKSRVVRGGSYNSEPRYVRSASRDASDKAWAGSGFRLARTMP